MPDKTKRRIVCGGLLLLFLAGIITATVLSFDTLTGFVKDPAHFREIIASHGFWGKCIFVLLMAAQVVLAVIPGHPFEIAGGICFGIFEGTLLTLLGAAIGSAANFGLTKLFGVRAVTAFYPEEKLQKVFFLRESKRQDLLTFITFLIPGIPKDMLAYFMGLTQMRFWRFLLLSSLGRLPGIVLAVIGGTAAEERSVGMWVAFSVFFFLLILLSLFLYRVQVRAIRADAKKSDSQATEEEPAIPETAEAAAEFGKPESETERAEAATPGAAKDAAEFAGTDSLSQTNEIPK